MDGLSSWTWMPSAILGKEDPMATMKNVKKLPKWQRKLTAAQRRHLRESMDGAVTLAGLRNNLAGQREDGCRCFECEDIARSLGMEG